MHTHVTGQVRLESCPDAESNRLWQRAPLIRIISITATEENAASAVVQQGQAQRQKHVYTCVHGMQDAATKSSTKALPD